MGQNGLFECYIEPYLVEVGSQAEIVTGSRRLIVETEFAVNCFFPRLSPRANTSEDYLPHPTLSAPSILPRIK